MSSNGVVLNKHVLDSLQSDLRSLSAEARKRFPAVKEAAEKGILQLRSIADKPSHSYQEAVAGHDDIPSAFVLGCQTKFLPLVQKSLACLNRLISYNACSYRTITSTIDAMDGLYDSNMEQIRICQTVNTLLTSSSLVRGETLGKTSSLCFKLFLSKEPIIANTAAASLRQLVAVLFERGEEEINLKHSQDPDTSKDDELLPCATDAYLFLQDLCSIINGDELNFVKDAPSIPSSYALELLETALDSPDRTLLQTPRFSAIVKERICPIVIKCFSTNIKKENQNESQGKLSFTLCCRLLRITSVLIIRFFQLLSTECEIFLSMLVKFLDPQRPIWTRGLAVEVIRGLCCHPILLKEICMAYDMQTHATQIFRNIVDSLNNVIDSLFNENPNLNIPGHLISNHKNVMLDSLDKVEAPVCAPEYILSCAVSALLDVIKGIAILVFEKVKEKELAEDGRPLPTGIVSGLEEFEDLEEKKLFVFMIDSSWPVCLSSLSILLEVSDDEDTIEAILRGYKTACRLCALIGMNEPRDGFIMDLCKYSLPLAFQQQNGTAEQEGTSEYDQNNIGQYFSNQHQQQQQQQQQPQHLSSPQQQRQLQQSHKVTRQGHGDGDMSESQDIASFTPSMPSSPAVEDRLKVGIGTSPSTRSLSPRFVIPANVEEITMSNKNIQVTRSLLGVTQLIGNVLEASWYLVLETLQFVDFIVAKHTKHTRIGASANNGGSSENRLNNNAQLADIGELLDRLFFMSSYMRPSALKAMIKALCCLSEECVKSGAVVRNLVSNFLLPRLLTLCTTNMFRVMLYWPQVLPVLCFLAGDKDSLIRLSAIECYTKLVHVLLEEQDKVQESDCKPDELEAAVFYGLQMIGNENFDTQEKQLECLLQLLQSFGQSLTLGWPYVLEVVSVAAESFKNTLAKGDRPFAMKNMRVAFESVQLIVTDFLSILPNECLHGCVDAVGMFGLQKLDVNISLTAVGLLWHIADYLDRDKDSISKSLRSSHNSLVLEQNKMDENWLMVDHTTNLSGTFSALWVTLFSELAKLCIDNRPEVRKSSNQTLFGTINMHGNNFGTDVWLIIFWEVLFPLLKNVEGAASKAVKDEQFKDEPQESILIHHSRNTEEKQWNETKVNILTGTTSVFSKNMKIISTLPYFDKKWFLLLDFVRNFGTSESEEVSVAAVSCFRENLSSLDPTKKSLWHTAWDVWVNIGSSCTPDVECVEVVGKKIHSKLLEILVEIFPELYTRLKDTFDSTHLDSFLKVSKQFVISVSHQKKTMTAYEIAMAASSSNNISPLHSKVLGLYDIVDPSDEEWPRVLEEILFYLSLCFNEQFVADRNLYTPLFHRSLNVFQTLYSKVSTLTQVIEEEIFRKALEALGLAMAMKYKCKASVWRDAVNAFMAIVKVGFDAFSAEPKFLGMNCRIFVRLWSCMLSIVDEYLFLENDMDLKDIEYDDRIINEDLDIAIIESIKTYALKYHEILPREIMTQLISTVRKGSVLDMPMEIDLDQQPVPFMRQRFSKVSFQVLLSFSFAYPSERDVTSASASAPAIPSSTATPVVAASTINTTSQMSSSSIPSIPEPTSTRTPISTSTSPLSVITDNYTSPPETPKACPVSAIAIDVLLGQCESVLTQYHVDERQSGKCPLPWSRMVEVCSVLKALDTLLLEFLKKKKAGFNGEDQEKMELFIKLYPVIVECIVCNDDTVKKWLKLVLLKFGELQFQS